MTKEGKVLIVDDDKDVLYTGRLILKNHFEKVITESTPERIERILKDERVDVIVLDMNFKAGVTTGNEGLFWLRKILTMNPEQAVLMNTAYGDIELAVECMKEGAIDFLVKPWQKEKLLSTVKAIYDLNKSKQRVRELEDREQALVKDLDSPFQDLIFKSSAMQKVLEVVDKVAATDANVMILGENGTGKEVIARVIHRKSNRQKLPFIKVDLGALSETLFESEVFGHVKGAYTDAKENRTGRFEMANKGTLFLDEIGNLSATIQVKLLSALQNRQIFKVGSSKPIDVDVRLISATNQPILEMSEDGIFRKDLLYRINTVEINLPPLRERVHDIEPLTRHFINIYQKKYQKDIGYSKDFIEQLKNYHWPGNVRELQHSIERCVIMSSEDKLTSHDFQLPNDQRGSPEKSLNIEEVEKATIAKALEECGGNISLASRQLGMGRTTLYRKMRKYDF
ncbi:MAG TPA: sigma-54-dependent transcriptional regulator [Cyclobacteriaceae bacterium]